MNRFPLLSCFVGPMLVGVASLISSTVVSADDWPQWMGVNRNAKVSNFVAPASWPKELKKQWSVEVGNGVATPALVGNRLYVFARQGGEEVTRCLDADTGKEIWQDKYATESAVGGARAFPGPRSSPTVAEGKVVVYGVRGVLSCLDSATGKVLWRKNSIEGVWPRFFTSSSPIIASGLCIAQLGGEEKGSIAAFSLEDGSQKWSWDEAPGTAYASPILVKSGGSALLIAETDENIVALNVADGKLLWEVPFKGPGDLDYNAATPIIDGMTLFITGAKRGVKAMSIEGSGSKLASRELWSNMDNSVKFNTPVLKNGYLYGISASDVLFCIDAKTGKTTWSAPVRESAQAVQPPPADGGKGKQGAKGGRGGGGGWGSIVDVGSVLFTLTPAGELGVIEPNGEKLVRLAKYKVADTQTHAYPVINGKRIYIKDETSVTLYTLE